MTEQQVTSLFNPLVQYGFAGFCFVLVGVIIWLICQLLGVIKENNKIIQDNSSAITKLISTTNKNNETGDKLKELLLQRPCIARFKVNDVK